MKYNPNLKFSEPVESRIHILSGSKVPQNSLLVDSENGTQRIGKCANEVHIKIPNILVIHMKNNQK